MYYRNHVEGYGLLYRQPPLGSMKVNVIFAIDLDESKTRPLMSIHLCFIEVFFSQPILKGETEKEQQNFLQQVPKLLVQLWQHARVCSRGWMDQIPSLTCRSLMNLVPRAALLRREHVENKSRFRA